MEWVENNNTCPICRKELNLDQVQPCLYFNQINDSIDKFFKVYEEKQSSNKHKCQKHGEYTTLYCMKKKDLVCTKCIQEEGETVAIKSFENLYNLLAKEISETLNNMAFIDRFKEPSLKLLDNLKLYNTQYIDYYAEQLIQGISKHIKQEASVLKQQFEESSVIPEKLNEAIKSAVKFKADMKMLIDQGGAKFGSQSTVDLYQKMLADHEEFKLKLQQNQYLKSFTKTQCFEKTLFELSKEELVKIYEITDIYSKKFDIFNNPRSINNKFQKFVRENLANTLACYLEEIQN